MLKHRGDPWWEEVFQLYAGQIPDASMLLQKLLGQEDGQALQEDIFHTNLLLAGRCLAARPRIRRVELREEIISRLFDLLQSSPYSLTIEQVAEVLAAVGGAEVNKRLLSLLYDKQFDENLCEAIVQALKELGDRSLVPDLLILLKDKQLDADDTFSSLRTDIAQALGRLGDRSLVPDLLVLLKDEQLDSSVRGEIAQALGQSGDRSVVSELLPFLKDKKLEANVRSKIAQALGQLGERGIVPELLLLLKQERLDLHVRENIVQALGQLIQDETEVKELANIMLTSEVADGIHRALWSASRWARVIVYVVDEPEGKRVELIKW